MEHLEQFAANGDAENETISSLQNTITHLRLEEVKKNEERQRHNKVGGGN